MRGLWCLGSVEWAQSQGPQVDRTIRRSPKSTTPSPSMSWGHASQGPHADSTSRRSGNPMSPLASRSAGQAGSSSSARAVYRAPQTELSVNEPGKQEVLLHEFLGLPTHLFPPLAVGAPLDNSLGFVNSGEVTVIYGSAQKLDATRHQIVNMLFFDTLETFDEFGTALATGSLLSGAATDLLIGAPGRDVPFLGGSEWSDAGVAVLVQSVVLFNDGFESGDTSAWE